jgi:hypothetical protein
MDGAHASPGRDMVTQPMPALVKRRPRAGLSDRAIRLGLKPLVFAVSLGPAAYLVWAALTHQLNVNPFNAIVRSTGFWSLRFLCLTLAVTPFRWLTGWHSVVKFRRMIGRSAWKCCSGRFSPLGSWRLL